MTCLSQHKDGAEILVAYFERTLDSERAIELERHMGTCAECRGLAGVWTTLDEWKAPEVSEDFDARLYARISQESAAPWWSVAGLKRMLTGESWWKPVLPLAAGCAVLALALMIRTPEPVPAGTKAKLGSVNIEQVEQALEDLDLLAPSSKEL